MVYIKLKNKLNESEDDINKKNKKINELEKIKKEFNYKIKIYQLININKK